MTVTDDEVLLRGWMPLLRSLLSELKPPASAQCSCEYMSETDLAQAHRISALLMRDDDYVIGYASALDDQERRLVSRELDQVASRLKSIANYFDTAARRASDLRNTFQAPTTPLVIDIARLRVLSKRSEHWRLLKHARVEDQAGALHVITEVTTREGGYPLFMVQYGDRLAETTVEALMSGLYVRAFPDAERGPTLETALCNREREAIKEGRREALWQTLIPTLRPDETACTLCGLKMPKDTRVLQNHYRYGHSLNVGSDWCSALMTGRWQAERYAERVRRLALTRIPGQESSAGPCDSCLQQSRLHRYADSEGMQALLCDKCGARHTISKRPAKAVRHDPVRRRLTDVVAPEDRQREKTSAVSPRERRAKTDDQR